MITDFIRIITDFILTKSDFIKILFDFILMKLDFILMVWDKDKIRIQKREKALQRKFATHFQTIKTTIIFLLNNSLSKVMLLII